MDLTALNSTPIGAAARAVGRVAFGAVSGVAGTLSGVVFRSRGAWSIFLNRTRFDYRAEVGDPSSNSIVGAVVGWIARNFPEAPVRIVKEGTTDIAYMPSRTGPGAMLRLLERPNQFYSGVLQWMATVVDRIVDGNAYWFKVRIPAGQFKGRVRELWWLPAHMVEPRWDERDKTVFISYYEYTVDGVKWAIPPRDIVHFRNGLDPNNPRKGRSKLHSLMREIFTDDEAANFTASLMRNLGVPGVVLAPSNTGLATGRIDAEAVKTTFMEKFSGDKRGEPMVMTSPTDIKVLSWSPEQMNLTALRRIPEERVSGVLGVPAMVAQLGAGLERSSFCLPADARVWTTSGPRRIVDIQPGDEVWSFDAGGLVKRRVLHTGMTGTKPIYRLRTKNRVLRATGNHPVLTRIPGHSLGANSGRHPTYEWRRMDALLEGDQIVQPKALPDLAGELLPDGRPATTGLLRFLGAILGDGTVTPGVGVRMAIPQTDRVAAEYRVLASTLFTRQARASGGVVALQDRVERAPITIGEHGASFTFSTATDSRWLADLGVAGRAHTKRIPGWVYGLTRELRLALLAGLVDTDGYIDRRGALTFTFCSRDLVEDCKDLMLSLGITSSNISHKEIEAFRLPQPGSFDVYEAWTITASSARAVAEIPFADPLYRERVDANPDRYKSDGFDAQKTGLSDDLGFYTIGSIVEEPAQPIYDLEIADSHSFIADGVVVHNTNYSEANVAAYTQGVIPDQRLMAAELEVQLLPEFANLERENLDVWFDWTKVSAMQFAFAQLWKTQEGAATKGLTKRSDFKRAVGLPVAADGSDDVYVMPNNYVAVPAGGSQPPSRRLALPGGNGAEAPLLGGDPAPLLLTMASEVRCAGCHRLLAEQAAPPYRFTCPRCHKVTESAAATASKAADTDAVDGLRAAIRSLAEPPVVHVEAPIINVPQAAAPIINVPTDSFVAAITDLKSMLTAKKTRRIVRDKNNQITGVVEEPV